MALERKTSSGIIFIVIEKKMYWGKKRRIYDNDFPNSQ